MQTRTLSKSQESEAGYTLVEVVVALALLLTVLVPTASALVYLTATPRIETRMEALARAQLSMEAQLAQNPVHWKDTVTEESPWSVHASVERTSTLSTIRIAAVHRGDTLVELSTARYVPPPVRNDE